MTRAIWNSASGESACVSCRLTDWLLAIPARRHTMTHAAIIFSFSTTAEQLLDDRQLRSLDLERFPFADPAFRIASCHGVAHDPKRCIGRHDPFGDPEFPFRLLFRLTIAHRKIH